ncbi:hypothetical protein SELR_pSRC300080 (plasmid) [Selenomonas ruminantium subsp. lactilytica TAM6421]|uniref:Uncharacterized protein n=1 Tax=Selenomonas ruminantium subsp. lactilytica (strain NBRC 103574 / TAM6421) TaxID=927704 RepID=I0GWE4_SELRL|nr:hypothetical protein SELR_pSRC300080 [Selenomonas ruminantium subsp. lactilytica TAM6421]
MDTIDLFLGAFLVLSWMMLWIIRGVALSYQKEIERCHREIYRLRDDLPIVYKNERLK